MKKHVWNRRTLAVFTAFVFCLALAAIVVSGLFWGEKAGEVDFTKKNLAPCLAYPFGTDWMGRDMLARTLAGLSLSIRIGILTALISSAAAFFLGLAAAVLGRGADTVISSLIDAVMGIPHILLLILISFAAGRGIRGVVIGISLTHWTSLARLIRGEVLQLKERTYIKAASRLGASPFQVALRHMTPHLLPQLLTGLVLMFPHAILHEASITFLGFGLAPEQPAIGVILSESMRYLSMGKWWLALFPGLFLTCIVMAFHLIGDTLNTLLDPLQAHVL